MFRGARGCESLWPLAASVQRSLGFLLGLRMSSAGTFHETMCFLHSLPGWVLLILCVCCCFHTLGSRADVLSDAALEGHLVGVTWGLVVHPVALCLVHGLLDPRRPLGRGEGSGSGGG